MNHVKMQFVLVMTIAVMWPGIFLAVVTMYNQQIAKKIIILFLDVQLNFFVASLKVPSRILQ